MRDGQSSALLQLYLAEARSFMREPIAVFFTFLFPLMLVLFIGGAFGTEAYAPDEPDSPFHNLRTIDLFIPSMFGIAAANLGLLGLPAVFAGYRETGLLRRFRATPLSLRTLFATHSLVQFTMLVAISIVLIAVVWPIWGLRFPGAVGPMLFAFLAGAILMLSLGFMLSGVVRTARQAQATGAAIFFPGLFLSGATIPLAAMPPWLRDVSEALPLTPMNDILMKTWAGHSMNSLFWDYLTVACFTGASLLLIRSTFRWE